MFKYISRFQNTSTYRYDQILIQGQSLFKIQGDSVLFNFVRCFKKCTKIDIFLQHGRFFLYVKACIDLVSFCRVFNYVKSQCHCFLGHCHCFHRNKYGCRHSIWWRLSSSCRDIFYVFICKISSTVLQGYFEVINEISRRK